MLDYKEFIKRLTIIRDAGFEKSHRHGDTGIGKTLEDLLGIKENNIAGPDLEEYELKAMRKDAGSMLTLFTKSPNPKAINSVLLEKYGYPSAKGKGSKELHTTIKFSAFNSLKGQQGFKLNVLNGKILILNNKNEEVCYWDKIELKEKFETKYPGLAFVKADCREVNGVEQFWFNECYLLKGFSFENFVKLIKNDKIVVDIRLGQYANGAPHDHGTGFRVMPKYLDDCFEKKERII